MMTIFKREFAQLFVVFFVSLLFSCSSTPDYSKDFEFSEYSPTVSADGKTMIYQADLSKKGIFKIYIKQKTRDGWSDSKLLDNVNSEYSDGGSFITYDQNNLIITSNRLGGIGGADLWISRREGDRWTEPENFGEPVNSSGYDGFASLSPDGNTLYFVRKCPGKDECAGDKLGIFISIKEDGEWSEPEKMSEPINTDYCEFGPVILADGKTLIFSSTRPGGFGNYDLYRTVKQEDGAWSKPTNFGDFINTEFEDSLVTIPASGEIIYYTKAIHKDKETSRIFSTPMPKEKQHSEVITVAGAVMDSSDPSKFLHAKIKIIDVNKSKDPITVESNKNDGMYIVILNKGKVYDISVSGSGYSFYSTQIDLTDVKEYREIERDILLDPIRVGTRIVLNKLFFQYRSSKLLDKSKFELLRIINMLQDNPTMRIEIGGHTDNVGSKTYNRKLSRKRARSVMDYMIMRGIEKNRLVAKGYGEVLPIASNRSETGKKKNRRVEIKILRQ